MRDLKSNLAPPRQRKRWLLFVGSMLLLSGVALLQGMMFQRGRAVFFGDDAVGVITGADVGRSGRNYPKIRFESRDGAEVSFMSDAQRSAVVIGKEVSIRYATGDPSVAYVGTRQSLYGNLAMGGFFSCVMFLVGGLFIWEALRIKVS